jgi:hypothetical protein
MNDHDELSNLEFLDYCRIRNKEDLENSRCNQKHFDNMERLLDNALKSSDKECEDKK